MRRGLVAIACCVGALALPVSSAGAATIIGQTFAPAAVCSSGTGWVQDGTPSEVIPSDGVITSFSAGTELMVSGQTELLVLSHVSGTTYHVEAKSDPGAMTGTIPLVQSFPTRISVHAGELIGAFGLVCDTALPGSSFHTFYGADPAVGTDQAFPTYNGPDFGANLSAKLEPDADCDGLGDETQDPAVTTCPKPPASASSQATGQRSAALKKCKKKHSARARRRCRQKANLLPL